MSHPVWVRGLKQESLLELIRLHAVAPRVGAWIETVKGKGTARGAESVAPRVGAWIETIHVL